ncbi:Hypp5977 [Branchiostoma lanceolatum]|uniref:Hypp5977 protein n=1 Tax=Branchiostoma lanceolatum TaxID=7740 RepID=A0A8J9VLM5_BRALA|nr:Hypp5977 [Branchiostoma lanceolatum]
MFETKTLSVDDPLSLQRQVYFYIAFYLCRRGRENLKNFKASDFVANTDGGRKYYCLRYTRRIILVTFTVMLSQYRDSRFPQ